MTNTFSFPQSSAPISWVDGNGIAQLHVFSCDGNMVTQRYWAGSGWATGSFSQQGSHVSASAYWLNGAAYLRVYCTWEGVTTEYCQDAGSTWYTGSYSPS